MPKLALLVFAVLVVLLAPGAVAQNARTRHYYLAAEEAMWNYAPSERTLVHVHPGGRLPKPWAGQTRWRKTRFVEYTDDTFTTRKPQPAWLGVLGPIMRAEVGDTVMVHFLNRSKRPASVHPHGLRYTKEHEGADYQGAGPGGRVPPGGRFTYTWTADESVAPGPGDPSSLVWWYHSHVDEPADVNAGLLGPLIVTAAGKAREDGSPVDVDRELVVMMMIFDEAKGEERGLMHSINGFIFGNVPGLEMNRGERVRWYLLGMGNEKDLHTLHWHARTVRFRQRVTDVVELLPGTMVTADMVADNPGTWLLHCHVADHFYAGMLAGFTIRP